MIYYIVKFKSRPNSIDCIYSIRELAQFINQVIEEDKLQCSPVSKHVIATWTCKNKKAKKYDFVDVQKINRVDNLTENIPIRIRKHQVIF